MALIWSTVKRYFTQLPRKVSFLPRKIRAQTSGHIKRKHIHKAVVPVVLWSIVRIVSCCPAVIFNRLFFLHLPVRNNPFLELTVTCYHITHEMALTDRITSKTVSVVLFSTGKHKKKIYSCLPTVTQNAVITTKAQIARAHILILTLPNHLTHTQQTEREERSPFFPLLHEEVRLKSSSVLMLHHLKAHH